MIMIIALSKERKFSSVKYKEIMEKHISSTI